MKSVISNDSVIEISSYFSNFITENRSFSTIFNKLKFEYGFLYKNATKVNIFCWKIFKQMYSFSEDWKSSFTSNMILKMSGTEFLERIKTLTFNSFFILNNSIMSTLFNTDKNYGYIITVLPIMNRVYILISSSDSNGKVGSNSLVFYIECLKTLSENLSRLSFQKTYDETESEKEKEILIHVLKYILYLSVANDKLRVGEIEYKVALRKKLNRSEDTLFHFDSIVEGTPIEYDEIREVTEPNIVYIFSNKSNITMSTHSRRGHYHRYWVGKGANRHLESRWVNAAVINPDKKDMKCVVHNVK